LNFFNTLKSDKLLKLEAYAINKIDQFNCDLYLVTKRKKWDLNCAMKNEILKLSDKVFIAQQLCELLSEI